jgi:S-adenosyl methyltransferase
MTALTGTGTPDQGRVYNYWLGGKDNYEADRKAGDMLLQAHPGMRTLARENRAFVLTATAWLARNKDIRQFIDLGCGIPVSPPVHELARGEVPGAAVAYVDRDPMVMAHVRALQAGPGLAAVEADVTDTDAVLGHPELGKVIDLGEPAALILGGTLSDMPASTARDAVARYMARLAPGSAAVISCAHFDNEEVAAAIGGMFPAWMNHTREDVAGFFTAGGLQLPRGQIGDVRCWPMMPSGNGRDARVLGGVGLLP